MGKENKESNKGYEIGARQIVDVQSIAEEIARNPEQWVLFLGQGISFDAKKNGKDTEKRKQIIVEMAQKINKNKCPEAIKICEAAQNQDYDKMEDILFGDIWDGAVFLENYRARQIKRRKEFAKRAVRLETTNIEFARQKVQGIDLTVLLQIFKGIILTTCQDETIEAFLEYEDSVPVEESVCTPNALNNSPKWRRRIDELLEKMFLDSTQNNTLDENHILIKLYGSIRDYKQMLLSKNDFEAYYPCTNGEQRDSYTVRLLKKLFREKNLLFIGIEGDVEIAEDDKASLKLCPGVKALLKDTVSPEIRRYVFAERDANKITDFADKLAEEVGLASLGNNKVITHPGKIDTASRAEGEAEGMTFKDAYHIFKRQYARRPMSDVPKREIQFLKEGILGTVDERIEKCWNMQNVELLAITANNLADFFDLGNDLDTQMKLLQIGNRVSDEELKKAIVHMIEVRLSKNSRELYRLLVEYGQGFPSGFFEFLSENEIELRELKRAAVQLTNSGICTKRQQRKKIHRGMKYADSLMMTAGTNQRSDKKRFAMAIREIDQEIKDSYFYISDVVEFDKDEYGNNAKEKLERMCEKLCHALENRNDGYNHYCSLLETEMSVIINKLEWMDSKLEWKPKLVYYMFRENRMIPVLGGEGRAEERKNEIEKELEKMLSKLGEITDSERRQECLYSRMMLFLAIGILKSQSCERENQEAAIGYCEKAENIFNEMNNIGTVKEEAFSLAIQTYFLKSRIYGRISTLAEIDRCEKSEKESHVQFEKIGQMKQCLDTAEKKISDRKMRLGGSYNEIEAELSHYMGEYFFKLSQYYWENRKYGGQNRINEEQNAYVCAENKYDEAIKRYDRYPHQFELQLADVMRNKADLFCQRSKSGEDGEKKRFKDICYDILYNAYEKYRRNADLHGIANVLQSMGNVENYEVFIEAEERNRRSSICFYNAASSLYEYLGDEWSRHVVNGFKKGAMEKRKNI